MWNTHICKTFTSIGIPKHWRLSLVQLQNFYYLLDFWVCGMRKKRDKVSTMLTVSTSFFSQFPSWTARPNLNSLTQQTRAHPAVPTGPIYVRISTNCFFLKSTRIPAHRIRAWRHSHPQSYFLSGGFIMRSVIVTPPRACVNTCIQCVPLHVQ